MTIQVPPVGYVTPATLDEAVELLADPTVSVIGGGTDLVPKMKRRQATPVTLVSLAHIDDMAGIRVDDTGNCIIGASTTLVEIVTSPTVPRVVAVAAESVASPQIRNTGTIGGNLCIDTRCNYIDMPLDWRRTRGHCLKDGGDTCWVAPKSNKCWAISSTDLAPVMIALDATVRLVSGRGERSIPVEALYHNDGMDYLTKAPDEILIDVTIPPFDGRASYQKLRRRGSIDFGLLGVAAAVSFDAGGVCTTARIAVGGIASAPLRATDAEEYLVGKVLTDETIDEASELVSKAFRSQDNTDTGSRYRKWMIPVHAAKALHEVAGGDGEAEGNR
ncbi:MAG: xanthine dehydrogenase family protein subunit M [Acidimicrobiia bacterium]